MKNPAVTSDLSFNSIKKVSIGAFFYLHMSGKIRGTLTQNDVHVMTGPLNFHDKSIVIRKSK